MNWAIDLYTKFKGEILSTKLWNLNFYLHEVATRLLNLRPNIGKS